jgi:hypothetical protein
MDLAWHVICNSHGAAKLPHLQIHAPGQPGLPGLNRAVMQLPAPFSASSIKGLLAAYAWRALELVMQVRHIP